MRTDARRATVFGHDSTECSGRGNILTAKSKGSAATSEGETISVRDDQQTRSLSARHLIIAGRITDLSSHDFNELLGYKLAAIALGFVPYVFVQGDAPKELLHRLDANATFNPPQTMEPITASNVAGPLDALFDAADALDDFWATIEGLGITSNDILLFPNESAVVLLGVGIWLARLPSDRRPSVFFRVRGTEFIDPITARFGRNAQLYRLAGKDLLTREGQSGVFLLANSKFIARAATRLCSRRAFLMPMPKFISPPSHPFEETRQKTIYAHLNVRSGRLIHDINNIIRKVRLHDPTVHFLVKFCRNCSPRGLPITLDPDVAEARC